ncbi:uncharacterized protein LOC142528305 [Primulina tabacum]|uniref:uncharacterized protein LOC142528305 n=1 Tax=Primulina tabacum TaxID=48773 RepID=UPI003F593877
MEFNHEFPLPTDSNRERASNIHRDSTPEEFLSKESYGANINKPLISYHRIYPDGEYIPVMLSPSYGFCPEDDQLIVDYLNKEINKEDAPYNRIPKVNIYNHTPEELAELHQSLRKNEWHFYSPRDRKYFNGSRPNRAAGNGFWKASGADKKIYRDGKSVGSKMCLVFYQGTPKQSIKTTWIMYEYVADQPQRRRLPNGTDDMRLDDCVLCRIYKKPEYSPKEEKGADASQCGEIAAKPEACESSENKEQVNPMRVKTEHEGTNQQQNLPVIQPSLQTQQQNLQVPQQNLSMSQLNQHAMHYRLWRWGYNLRAQLDFHLEKNPEVMLQPNLERASNIQRASTPEEVLCKESYGPNNKPVISYHRRYPDGKYVAVMLSPGFGFNPEDNELIVDYLNKEINKEYAPYNRIPKVNVYNHTPEELAELHQSLGKDEWYLYSPRDRKYFNGSRPNRAAGNGFWKATGADKKIYRDGKSVGSKKCLVFYQGKPKQSIKTIWIMHEYVADQAQKRCLLNGTDDMRLDDCVLCRIYKKSEYSPKEEKGAAASQSGETAAKTEACESSENKNQATPKRVKIEREGTNQQHNLPVLQPNLQMQQQNFPMIQPNLPTQQHNLPVIQRNLSMPQQNLQIIEQNLPTPQQNQQVIQYSLQPQSNYLGGQLRFRPESIPEEAKPIMLHPNIPTSQPIESIPKEVNQFNFDNIRNGHETVCNSTPMDTLGNSTYPPLFHNGFRYNDLYPLSSLDSFDPIPPWLYNNDHPQDGSLIQGDELVFPKAETSTKACNPREKS